MQREKKRWENIHLTDINRLPAHTDFYRYSAFTEALKFNKENSKGYVYLYGMLKCIFI